MIGASPHALLQMQCSNLELLRHPVVQRMQLKAGMLRERPEVLWASILAVDQLEQREAIWQIHERVSVALESPMPHGSQLTMCCSEPLEAFWPTLQVVHVLAVESPVHQDSETPMCCSWLLQSGAADQRTLDQSV